MQTFKEWWGREDTSCDPIVLEMAREAWNAGVAAAITESAKRINAKLEEGYAIVPVEPTEDMVWEAIRVMDEGMITVDQVDVKLAYKAMIQAAQEDP